MPIIAKVGRRSWSTRLLLGSIYAVLILGGASMIYPFLLMFATSTTGEPEIAQYRIIPRYWFDRGALYQRFVQEKYQNVADFTPLHTSAHASADSTSEVHLWRDIAMPLQTRQTKNAAELWRTFCGALRTSSFDLWYIGRRNMPGKSELLWRDYLKTRYATPADLGRAFGREVGSFTEVFAPYEKTEGRLWPGVEGAEGADWDAFKKSSDPDYRRPVDGLVQWRGYLHQRYEQIAQFNRMAGTTYADFTDIPLPRRLPAGPIAADWEAWVRTQLGFRFVGLDHGDRLYARFLVSTFGSLDAADAQLQTKYALELPVAWPPANPTTAELDAIDDFLRNLQPISVFSVATPDVQYQDFLESKLAGDVSAYNAQTGEHVTRFADVRPPYAQEDIAAFDASAGAWRWWALTRNYAEVIDYIAIRGRSLWNTLFLCGSLVLASVTVNPLAAYALSRFRLSLTNQILTFLLATMAFPGEVTMIPNFLLLRHFPIWSWAVGLIVGAGFCYVFLRKQETSALRWIIALMLGLLAGVSSALYLVPGIGHLIGVDLGPISLLNTFPALILPRLAGGFSIFLLKGFFDSLPEELFEAGRIDGAGELRMLWNLALPMSTPILAVIVLQTFTAAYGSYLWALVVCQDDSMWTLMVHIFQLQQWAPSYLTMAAAVLCSIPTLLVFVAAQNVIMRGVVVPMER